MTEKELDATFHWPPVKQKQSRQSRTQLPTTSITLTKTLKGRRQKWGKASLKTKYNDSVFQPGILLLLICICQAQAFVFVFALLLSWEAYNIKKWEHSTKKILHWTHVMQIESSLILLGHTCSQPGHSGLKINNSKHWPSRLRLKLKINIEINPFLSLC